MGLKTFTIGDAREAFEIICDGDSHDDPAPMALIDGGSRSGSSLLSATIGLKPRPKRKPSRRRPNDLRFRRSGAIGLRCRRWARTSISSANARTGFVLLPIVLA